MNKEKLLQRWQAWTEKFEALALRERILVTLGVLALVFLVWDFAFLGPTQKKQQALSGRFERATQELKKISAEEQVLVKALTNDPSVSLRKQVIDLQAELTAADKQVQSMSAGLVSAVRLPEILRDVLQQTGSLELLGMRHFEAQKLQLAEAEPNNPGSQTPDEQDLAVAAVQPGQEASGNDVQKRLAEERVVGVYKHSVRVTLKGGYFSVVEYLERLENLEWRFYWDFIDYSVQRYPMAEITLEVYTLSTDRGMLGV